MTTCIKRGRILRSLWVRRRSSSQFRCILKDEYRKISIDSKSSKWHAENWKDPNAETCEVRLRPKRLNLPTFPITEQTWFVCSATSSRRPNYSKLLQTGFGNTGSCSTLETACPEVGGRCPTWDNMWVRQLSQDFEECKQKKPPGKLCRKISLSINKVAWILVRSLCSNWCEIVGRPLGQEADRIEIIIVFQNKSNHSSRSILRNSKERDPSRVSIEAEDHDRIFRINVKARGLVEVAILDNWLSSGMVVSRLLLRRDDPGWDKLLLIIYTLIYFGTRALIAASSNGSFIQHLIILSNIFTPIKILRAKSIFSSDIVEIARFIVNLLSGNRDAMLYLASARYGASIDSNPVPVFKTGGGHCLSICLTYWRWICCEEFSIGRTAMSATTAATKICLIASSNRECCRRGLRCNRHS